MFHLHPGELRVALSSTSSLGSSSPKLDTEEHPGRATKLPERTTATLGSLVAEGGGGLREVSRASGKNAVPRGRHALDGRGPWLWAWSLAMAFSYYY